MALAYLINRTARASSRYRSKSGQISIVLLFIAAIVPDADFIFYEFVGHHTVTHSIIFWSVAYLPLFLRWRMKILPYYLATLSHILGDILLGKPPVFYGLWDQPLGPAYDYAIANLSQAQFMLARSLLDFFTVVLFLIARKRDPQRGGMLGSDRDAYVALPILGFLVISIAIASNMQGGVLPAAPQDWPMFAATYSILAATHALIFLLILKEVRLFLRRPSEPLRAREQG
jgi:hypothetical protein